MQLRTPKVAATVLFLALASTKAWSANAVDINGYIATDLNYGGASITNLGNEDRYTNIRGSNTNVLSQFVNIGTSVETNTAIGTFSGSVNSIGGTDSENIIRGTNRIGGPLTVISSNEVEINKTLTARNTTIGWSTNSGTISLTSGFSGDDYHSIDITPDKIAIGGASGVSTIDLGSVSGSAVNIGSRTGNSNIDFGGNRLQNVGNAVLGTDAVNLNQLNSAMNGVNSAISNIQSQVNSAKAGIAGVSAATNLPGLNSNQKYNFGIGWGNYMAYNGIAIGGNARITENVTMKASGSATSGVYSGGAGLAIGF